MTLRWLWESCAIANLFFLHVLDYDDALLLLNMVSTMKKSIFDEQTNKALRKLQKNAQKKRRHHDVVRAEWANHVIQF
ncbi:hypothetical protein RchiOBHm_Chr5g0061681 [Rosa chinensis]|uniref:Uncharacterized protein n=1 Tax=Rosa chinensis TaxID=74649 RepID=A0A2P6QHZ7_ROSCH|nr:hypothetical protein RchiOBHm_Chr5g0061681 [Rosa chinensis]